MPASNRLKPTVQNPIARPSDSTASAVTPGRRDNARTAMRRSRRTEPMA